MTTSPAPTFRQLHHGPGILLLPNCWDAGSARVLECAGARAVATTSAGLAWSWGYPDGNALPPDLLVQTVRAIARTVTIPLSVDVEGGYADEPAQVGRLLQRLLDEGIAGINIEDGYGSPDLLARKIETVRTVAERMGVDLFINARTDVYLRSLVEESARLAESVRRAAIFRDSGADGIFVPKAIAADDVRQLATTGMPLNLLAMPTLAAAATLATLGVRRVSVGSTLAHLGLMRAEKATEQFLVRGDCEHLYDAELHNGDMNKLLDAR